MPVWLRYPYQTGLAAGVGLRVSGLLRPRVPRRRHPRCGL